jgi:hypothetical protein
MLIVEDSTVTVKCRTAIKALFRFFNLCLSWIVSHVHLHPYTFLLKGCRGCDSMVVGFTTTHAISAYHH